jgi:uncharacterized glyoxalase superfamily protein PhnB
MSVKAVPEGYRTVTPYILAPDAPALIEFMAKAFGATEQSRVSGPDGRIVHAEVMIGDSRVMLAEATADFPAMPAMLFLYLEDVDAAFRQAVEAGAIILTEPGDQPYGDRSAGLKDTFGNHWWLSTHVRDVPRDQW